jgi:hypothetical protein
LDIAGSPPSAAERRKVNVMGDGGTKFQFDDLINVMQVEFTASRAAHNADPAEVRLALEEAIRHIPDSKLKGLRSFRLLIIP